jgi:hypothetical protein
MKRCCAVLLALLLLVAAAPAFAADVITAVTPSVAKIEVGKPFSVTVQGNLGQYTSCRVYLMRNTDQAGIKSLVATSDPAVAAAQPNPAEAKFPLVFKDVVFDKPGPGQGNAAFLHVWVGTSGDYPCGGQSFPAVTVTAYTPGGPVITKVTPAAAQVKVGEKLKVTVDGVIGSYSTCRIYLMLNTDQATTRHVDATTLPVTFEDVTFNHPGPGPNNTAWIHAWTGTKGDFACDGGSKDATVKVVPAPMREIKLQPGRQASPAPGPSRPPR